jgi:hypothetical protein
MEVLRVATTPALLTQVFRAFPQSFQTNATVVLRLGHDRLLPNRF